jgi:hypothetical protein
MLKQECAAAAIQASGLDLVFSSRLTSARISTINIIPTNPQVLAMNIASPSRWVLAGRKKVAYASMPMANPMSKPATAKPISRSRIGRSQIPAEETDNKISHGHAGDGGSSGAGDEFPQPTQAAMVAVILDLGADGCV